MKPTVKLAFASVLTCALGTAPNAFVNPAHAATTPTARAVRHKPSEVLLLENSNSPTSLAIGQRYTQLRHVDNVLQLQCPDSALKTGNETLSYADYSALIETPVRAYLAQHPQINFIVLTKGLPIRVKGGETGNRAGSNVASPSVDSCLSALDYASLPNVQKYQFTGGDRYGSLGYAWSNRYWDAHEPFSHAKFGGYLVSRLDGYTQADAIDLITRSVLADGHPPAGKVLLDVQPDFGLGDKATQPAPTIASVLPSESKWSEFNADMAHAADILQSRNLPYELDLDKTFIGQRSDLAGYYSWGSNDSHFKSEAYASLFFAPGSISDTAVSTCARTFLPTTGGQTLTADLLVHGLTAAKGYINEPWLQANSSPTIVFDRYTSGYNMAESFYAGSRFVGWEDILLGDPLCAPYWGK